MRKPISYSKCYSRRSREEEVRKEKKDTLKKIGYFVAGATTSIGVGYAVKKIFGNLDFGIRVDVSSNENMVMIHEALPKAPLFLKGFSGERLISHAEPLITKF